MGTNLPPCPQSLKAIQHYLKTAAEHEQRDVVIAYWCRLYALQTALKIDKKSDDAKMLLVALMDWLEKIKKSMTDNDAIANEIAAQAHIENYALKLFTWADSQDRAGVFNKNVIKAFYTAGMLMDVLITFGDLTEEIARNCKYAKWKAAYIHNCLKNGETPIPGPMQGEEDNLESGGETFGGGTPNIGFQVPNENFNTADTPNPYPNSYFDPLQPQPPPVVPQTPAAPPRAPAPVPTTPEQVTTPYYPPPAVSSAGNSMKLDYSQISKAQKYCKFAGSALNFDDIPEAITNLEKALHLLRTGEDS